MSIVKGLKDEHLSASSIFSFEGKFQNEVVSSPYDYTINTSNAILNHFTRITTPDAIEKN